MNDKPSFHEQLAAHLATQEHPLPHPKRYDHGYIKFSTIPLPKPSTPFHAPASSAAQCCTGNCNQGRACPSRLRDFGLSHPGPITMHEPDPWLRRFAECMAKIAIVLLAVSAGFLSGAWVVNWITGLLRGVA